MKCDICGKDVKNLINMTDNHDFLDGDYCEACVRAMSPAEKCKSEGIKLPSCLLCAVKHVSRAKILMGETFLGYPEHFFDALGELSMAETELVDEFKPLAGEIRAERLKLQDDAAYVIVWRKLYDGLLREMILAGVMPDNLVFDGPKKN